jgi:hypothetical protein
MNLRTLLRASGVSAKDLAEAIESSREVTRYAALGAELLATGLRRAAPKLQSEMAREIARKGVFLATKIQDSAELMLRSREEAPPPPRAPSGKKPKQIAVQIVEKKR